MVSLRVQCHRRRFHNTKGEDEDMKTDVSNDSEGRPTTAVAEGTAFLDCFRSDVLLRRRKCRAQTAIWTGDKKVSRGSGLRSGNDLVDGK